MLGMFRRRISGFLIDPKFQIGFLSKFLILGIVNYGVLFLCLSRAHKHMIDYGVESGLTPNSAYYTFIENQWTAVTNIFWIGGIFLVLSIMFAGLILSHRIAGPLYRLKKHMDAVSTGSITNDVKFRKKDYFPEVADGFNGVMKRIRENPM